MTQTTQKIQGIPAPTRNGNKINGEFYPLQKQELIALKRSRLINNVAFIHLALRYENPFCDRPIEIFPKKFALRWSIPESSVYEAISKLKDKGILKTRLGKVTIQWVVHSQQEADSDNPESILESQNKFRDPRMDSEIPENIPKSQNEFRDPRMDSEIPENQPPKEASDKGSGLSHTIQTNQTSQTIQKGVGVENSGSGSDLDLVNKEICASEQSYSEQEEVKEEKLVDKKDPGKDQSSADVAQVTTKRGTKSVSSEQLAVSSDQLAVSSEQLPVSSEQSPRHPVSQSPSHPVSPSPRLPVSPSPSHPVTQSPSLPVSQSPSADIPEDLISKLKDLGISLDGEVKRTIADHHISQAYGAIKHVENTWETINNPRGVFLHQIPNQRVQKGPPPISENFFEWYQWAIADGLVIDFPVKYLPTNLRGEPKVKLVIDPQWAEDWQKVRDNPDDYRQKLDPSVTKELWAKMGSVFKRTPEPEPETTLNDQLSDPILAEELYPKIKHSHQVDFTEEGRPYKATPIVDIKYDENGVPVEEGI